MKKIWAILLAVLLAGVVAATGIIISNNLQFGGELRKFRMEISYSDGDPGLVPLADGVPKIFNITVANLINEITDYHLNIIFGPDFAITALYGNLTRIYLSDGSYARSMETLSWSFSAGAWYAESGIHSLPNLNANWFELELTVFFNGEGSYTLDIVASQ